MFATAAAWGKTPVHARSTPGFIVNRVARPFYAEALRVLGEGGGDIATLDAVMREVGRLPHGSVRAHGPDRPRRELRRHPLGLRRVLPGPALHAVADPAGAGRRRVPRPQERARLLPLRRGCRPPGARRVCPAGPSRRASSSAAAWKGSCRCWRVRDRGRARRAARPHRDRRARRHRPDRRPHRDRAHGGRRRPAAGPGRPRARLRAGEPRGAGAGRPGVARGPCPGGRAVPGARQGGLAARRRAGHARDADGVHARQRGGRRGEPGRVRRGGGRHRDAARRELPARPAGLGARRSGWTGSSRCSPTSPPATARTATASRPCCAAGCSPEGGSHERRARSPSARPPRCSSATWPRRGWAW